MPRCSSTRTGVSKAGLTKTPVVGWYVVAETTVVMRLIQQMQVWAMRSAQDQRSGLGHVLLQMLDLGLLYCYLLSRKRVE